MMARERLDSIQKSDIPESIHEAEDDRSSATSGADADHSFEQSSFERGPSYDYAPEPMTRQEPVLPDEEPHVQLTQAELDYIAWIQQLAEQTAFEQVAAAAPSRPPVPPPPVRADSVQLPHPSIEIVEVEDRPRSSSTSGADAQRSFDEDITIEEHRYEEPIPEVPSLTQEELDHIAYIQKMAEQSSSVPVQPIEEVMMARERLDSIQKSDIPESLHEAEDDR